MSQPVFSKHDKVLLRNWWYDEEGFGEVKVKKNIGKKSGELCDLPNGTEVDILEYVQVDDDEDVKDKLGNILSGHARSMQGDKYLIGFCLPGGVSPQGSCVHNYKEGYVLRGHVLHMLSAGAAAPVPEARAKTRPRPAVDRPNQKRVKHDRPTAASSSALSGHPHGLMSVKDEPMEEPEINQSATQEFHRCKHFNMTPYEITRPLRAGIRPDPDQPICADCLVEVLQENPQATLQYGGQVEVNDPGCMIIRHWVEVSDSRPAKAKASVPPKAVGKAKERSRSRTNKMPATHSTGIPLLPDSVYRIVETVSPHWQGGPIANTTGRGPLTPEEVQAAEAIFNRNPVEPSSPISGCRQ